MRAAISEPARYYHGLRTIVMRNGLLITEERRHLWHELEHADRGDEACHVSNKMERSVDRAAAHRAMPLRSLEWAFGQESSVDEAAELLKLPAEWVAFRLDVAHPAELALVRKAAARSE